MVATPLLSIVTVTFNDPVGLSETLASLEVLKLQAGDDIEVLVQDGGSSIVSTELKERYAWLASFRSETDHGIYDGMNRALERSSGAFVWFLNGGDTSALAHWAPLAEELRRSTSTMILADYILKTGNRELVRRSRKPSYIWHGLPTSHQAIFYPGNAVRAQRYDLSYRIVGDYALTAHLIKGHQTVRNVALVVAAFQSGGLSQQQSERIAVEARKVQREILKTGTLFQILSAMRHAASRLLRRALTVKVSS